MGGRLKASPMATDSAMRDARTAKRHWANQHLQQL